MSHLDLIPGTLVATRYRLEHLLIQSGTGAMFQAVDVTTRRTVVLKHIALHDARGQKAFAREVRLLSRLRHPALPAIENHFQIHEHQFLVFEQISGDDLGTLLERNTYGFAERHSLPRVVGWADRLLHLLEYLHSYDPPIIHRDIRPQNLKCTARGDLVLLDFGLAKGSPDQHISSTSSRSVRSYTTQYAPLEQIQGTGTEPRSDLYALAATLYHLLTGSPPPNALTRASAVLTGLPDPLQLAHIANPVIPPALAAVLHQALAPGLARRFATANTMRQALRPIQYELAGSRDTHYAPVSAPPPPTPRGAVFVGSLADALALLDTTTETPATQHTVHHVDPGNPAAHATIGAALAAATDGDEIRIAAGEYHEAITINHAIHIQPHVPNADVVVHHDTATVLTCYADTIVKGLTIRAVATPDDDTRTRAAVYIAAGRATIEDCTIESHAQLGVLIHGAISNPALLNCSLRHSRKAGVLVLDDAHALLRECTIHMHQHAGVAVRKGGNPTLVQCTICDNQRDGIYISDHGQGKFEQCTIERNTRHGIVVRDGGAPLITNCVIQHQGNGHGVLLIDGGAGVVEDCTIESNGQHGIMHTGTSRPLLRTSNIAQNAEWGVVLASGSQMAIEQCTIAQNAAGGIEVQSNSNALVMYTTIRDHRAVGVVVHDQSAATIEHCRIQANQGGAWLLADPTRVVARNNELD